MNAIEGNRIREAIKSQEFSFSEASIDAFLESLDKYRTPEELTIEVILSAFRKGDKNVTTTKISKEIRKRRAQAKKSSQVSYNESCDNCHNGFVSVLDVSMYKKIRGREG